MQFVEKARDELLALLPGAMFFQQQLTELLFESVNQLQSRMASQIRSQPSWLFTGEVVPVAAHQQSQTGSWRCSDDMESVGYDAGIGQVQPDQ